MVKRHVLPVDLHVGDRFTDEEGDWEIVGHPAVFREGKAVKGLVRRVGQPGSDKEVTWPAHEKLAVRRTLDASRDVRLRSRVARASRSTSAPKQRSSSTKSAGRPPVRPHGGRAGAPPPIGGGSRRWCSSDTA